MNRRGVREGTGGKTCFNVTRERKSTIADAEVVLWRDACISWTLGKSSEIKSMTGSSGNLNQRETRQNRQINGELTLAAKTSPVDKVNTNTRKN